MRVLLSLAMSCFAVLARARSAWPSPAPSVTSAAVAAAETTFNNETRLLFYALHKQATAGPCKEGKPWSWNVVESAKWQSWSQLADMSSMDAMRLYVKTLDEEQVS